MEDAGLPAPEYEETPNTVKLILRNNIDERTAHRADKAPFIPADEGINEGINEGLSEDEKQLLACIRNAPKATQKWYAEETGFSVAKIERMMKKMREAGIIIRKGSKKNGVWEIIR